MATVEIYTTKVCPYCDQAKQLLKQKQVDYTEIRIDEDNDMREQMQQRAEGRRSVPQIFINNKPIGGCDDLYRLEHNGELDQLLN